MATQMFGQPLATQLKFEVASVKPSAPDSPGIVRYLPGGGLRITGATLQSLISIAYDLRPFQISGGPKWIDADRFDIDARLTTSDDALPANPPAINPGLTREDQWHAAEGLRSLLADRFLLTFHEETSEQPLFALVVAKRGPKLRDATESESFIRRTGPGSITGQAIALRLLVLNLANALDQPVIDKTGLTGKYTFELKWDDSLPSAAQSAAAEPNEGSIFTALQEQLGLRLESQKGPTKILVVDGAERPSKNSPDAMRFRKLPEIVTVIS